MFLQSSRLGEGFFTRITFVFSLSFMNFLDVSLCIAAISISRAPLSVDREKRMKKRVKYGDLFLNLIIKNVFLIKYYI